MRPDQIARVDKLGKTNVPNDLVELKLAAAAGHGIPPQTPGDL